MSKIISSGMWNCACCKWTSSAVTFGVPSSRTHGDGQCPAKELAVLRSFCEFGRTICIGWVFLLVLSFSLSSTVCRQLIFLFIQLDDAVWQGPLELRVATQNFPACHPMLFNKLSVLQLSANYLGQEEGSAFDID